jgi:hypothetical protein
MTFMQKFFSRYMEPEDGEGGSLGGGSDSGSTAPDTQTTDPSVATEGGSSDSSSGSDSGASSSAPANGEPASMLDAIEQGLKEIEGAGKPDAKPAGEQKPGEQKVPGEPEDPLKQPDGLHPKAAQRFQQLVGMVKERDQQLEQLKTSSQGAQVAASTMGRFIKETGATMDQFNGIGAYLKARNSGDVQTEANIVIGLLQDLQMRTGINLDELTPQLDPLSRFPDLSQAVSSYQITREHALELARAREQNGQITQQREIAQARQTEARQWIGAKDSSINTIKEWERQMAATDPDYNDVSAVMRENGAALDWVVKNTPPNQWQHHLTVLYNQTKAARKRFGPPVGQPNRPLANAGGKPQGAGKVAKNMFDAMFPNG